MPILPNPKHEAFAQALARGLSISAAYVQAGYKPNRGNAIVAAGRRLSAHPKERTNSFAFMRAPSVIQRGST
jgi:hypothetical protein